MKLSEFLERYPHLKPYFNVLSRFLYRPAHEIEVYSFSEARARGIALDERALGVAIPPDILMFREIPPPIDVFIHELIHLCRKPDVVHEEVYAYNLINLVMFCAEREIECNPFALFTLSVDEIESVLRRYGIQFIEEYFALLGVMPLFPDENEEYFALLQDARLDESHRRRLVMVFIAGLIAGIQHYPPGSLMEKILLDLIDLTAIKH
ncbi:MAG: hypothetical protein QW196_08265 [Sulfolobales archaeon]